MAADTPDDGQTVLAEDTRLPRANHTVDPRSPRDVSASGSRARNAVRSTTSANQQPPSAENYFRLLESTSRPNTRPTNAAFDRPRESALRASQHIAKRLYQQLGSQLDTANLADITSGPLRHTVDEIATLYSVGAGATPYEASLTVINAMEIATEMRQRFLAGRSHVVDPARDRRIQELSTARSQNGFLLNSTDVPRVGEVGPLTISPVHIGRKSALDIALEQSEKLQHDPKLDLSHANTEDFKAGGSLRNKVDALASQIADELGLSRAEATNAAEYAFFDATSKKTAELQEPNSFARWEAELQTDPWSAALQDTHNLSYEVEIDTTDTPREFDRNELALDVPADIADAVISDGRPTNIGLELPGIVEREPLGLV